MCNACNFRPQQTPTTVASNVFGGRTDTFGNPKSVHGSTNYKNWEANWGKGVERNSERRLPAFTPVNGVLPVAAYDDTAMELVGRRQHSLPNPSTWNYTSEGPVPSAADREWLHRQVVPVTKLAWRKMVMVSEFSRRMREREIDVQRAKMKSTGQKVCKVKG